jgi:zinc-binding alcohol dehydrogenase family protein
MRAVGFQSPKTPEAPVVLTDTELPKPVPQGRDLLVEIKAISVNPIDTKVRKSFRPDPGEWRVLGWDAAGVVVGAGPDATHFKPGDEVYYAGAIGRPGTNAEYNLVDEQIVGRKPKSLSWTEAAALPLTSLTAWEMLFDRLRIREPVLGAAKAVVIIGAGGGVGSMAVQLARQLTDLTVIGTGSRDVTKAWAKSLGAHHVIDHSKPIAADIAALGLGNPGLVFSITQTDKHIPSIVEFIAPQGRFGLIDDPAVLQIKPFKHKAVSIHWENMFTRSIFSTPDMAAQGKILNELAELIDEGEIKTTVAEHFGSVTAKNLTRAHAIMEAGTAKGKIVLEGFGS